jgi:rubredoxin
MSEEDKNKAEEDKNKTLEYEIICPNCRHGRYITQYPGNTLGIEMHYYHCDACQHNFAPQIQDETVITHNVEPASAIDSDSESENERNSSGDSGYASVPVHSGSNVN